jgi:hypothetical protein
MMLTRFVIVAAVSVFHTAALNGSPQEQVGQDQAIQFCLSGVKEHCKKLNSGRAKITGSLKTEFKNQPEFNLAGPVSGLVAYDGQKVRFDITRPGWVVDRSSLADEAKAGEPVKMMKGMLEKSFSDDGVKIAIWNSDQPMVTIGQLSDLPDRRVAEHINFRCPTLFDIYSIGQGWTLEHILQRFETEFGNAVAECVKDNEVWKLIWTYQEGGEVTRWVLTVDTSRGFVPVQYKCESADARSDERTWIPEWENSTEWEMVSDVWVPIRFERSIFSGPASSFDEKLVMELDWELVNEAIDDDSFTYRGFKVPEHVGIQDSSSGEAIWIKHLPSYEVPTLEYLGVTETTWTRSRLLLIIITLIGCLAISGWWAFRARSHQ